MNAYDVKTGRLLWSDVHGAPNDIDEVDGGVVVAGGQVFALGFVSADDGLTTHTEVRAYDAKTGTLLWDDLVDRNGFPFGITVTLAAAEGRLTAVSWVEGTPSPQSTGVDLLIRSYAIGGSEGGR